MSQRNKNVNLNKIDKIIEEHYLSCLNKNSNYKKKYSREFMKDWWYSKFKKSPKQDVELFILSSTHANNKGCNYHPV